MPNDYILRSDVEKLLNQTISEIENPNRERVLPDMQYQAMKEVLVAFLSELSSIQSVDIEKNIHDKYKQFCIGEYQKGDVIEVLICKDIDDGYSYAPETQYWYVSNFDLIRMSVFDENTTGEVLRLGEVKANSLRKTYKQLSDFGDFDSSYVIKDRKIEVIPHPGYNLVTVEREPILFTQPT